MYTLILGFDGSIFWGIFLLLKQEVCEALWNIFIIVAPYKSNLLLIEEIR